MKTLKQISLALLSTLIMNTQSAVAEVLTEIQLHAVLGVVTNFILDDGISHHGTTYGKVTSPYTGRVWLDRNLGANRVCTALDDTACYGDYYQWGRNHDGHQESNATSTAVKATDVSNAGAEFITSDAANNFDWASVDAGGSIRTANWFIEGANAVCPTGFRVPTLSELKAELLDANSSQIVNNIDAFDSFLKLPSAGTRRYIGNTIDEGVKGYLWSLTDNGSRASNLFYDGSTASTGSLVPRASGRSVRCIEKTSPEALHYHNGTLYGEVTSPYTGKVWLDRNLGAKKVCTALDDAECYGDYYQWGRAHDGHQVSTSNSTSTLATDVNSVGHSDFITNASIPRDWTSIDTNGSIRSASWSVSDGSSVCPVGFRVPSIAELQAELLNVGSAEIANNTDAFHSFLVLPSAGYRSNGLGALTNQDSWGFVWSSSVDGSYVRNVGFNSGSADSNYYNRANGLTVRCLRD